MIVWSHEPAWELVADSVPEDIRYITLLTCPGITTFNRLFPIADLENSDSPQFELLQQCGRGFHTGNPDLIAKALHKDYRYVSYPRSLGRPEQTKEERLEEFVGIISILVSGAEVSCIGCPSDLLRREQVPSAAESPSHRGTPGKLVVHVRI
jgi:hypothetical protein